MVCEKNKDTDHDFTKDPLKLRVEDGMIYATGTTLGADNGIAVAMGMAILSDNSIEHPEIEFLVTVDEEAGMSGAMNLDGSQLKAKYILNLDSEEEGYILVSCAGGATAKSTLPIEYTNVSGDKVGLAIDIKGLLGGHSGMDIIKQRGNSNKLLGRLLNLLNIDYDLAKVSGGSKNNAIPRESECIIAVNKNSVDEVKKQISDIEKIFKNELKTSDPGLVIEVSEAHVEKVFTPEFKDKVIKMYNLMPNGVQTMSMDIEGLVESSTNLGVVVNSDNDILFESAVRSSVSTLKDDILNRMDLLTQSLKGSFKVESSYPAWEYAKGSKLEEICIEAYEKLTGKKPTIMALHAGLECGLLLSKMNGAEAISFGPDMFDVHTPNEHLDVKSTENTWDYLLTILKSIH